jgi:hypothetical protein
VGIVCSSARRLDLLWGPSTLLSSGYMWLFPQEYLQFSLLKFNNNKISLSYYLKIGGVLWTYWLTN